MTQEEMQKIKKLGFGFMRLPMKDGEVDEAMLCKMVDEYMANAFTYFDTAFRYVKGNSEIYLKKTVVDRYPRDSFTIADKLPPSDIEGPEDPKKVFDKQLEKTGAGYFDFYLLHSLKTQNLELFKSCKAWEFIKEMKAKGLAKNIGFSFHDKPEVLDMILTEHGKDLDFVQLQINYADWENPNICSKGCYEVARKHNLPVVIMEPVKGGIIATMRPEIEGIFKQMHPDKSIPSWALRYCASLEGIVTVLSGMSNEEQMNDNIDTMKDFKPLTDEERVCIEKVKTAMQEFTTVACTNCKYCVEGCPVGIKIPDLFNLYNLAEIHGKQAINPQKYIANTSDNNKASDCISCGQCEAVCPQQLKIIDLLKDVAKTFE